MTNETHVRTSPIDRGRHDVNGIRDIDEIPDSLRDAVQRLGGEAGESIMTLFERFTKRHPGQFLTQVRPLYQSNPESMLLKAHNSTFPVVERIEEPRILYGRARPYLYLLPGWRLPVAMDIRSMNLREGGPGVDLELYDLRIQLDDEGGFTVLQSPIGRPESQDEIASNYMKWLDKITAEAVDCGANLM